MALLDSKIFHGLRGKVEKLVFYCARGQQRVRTELQKRRRRESKALELQSCRMRACIAFYRTNILGPLPHIWRKAAENKVATGYNLFLGANMRVFDRQHRISDYDALQVSAGGLELPTGWQVERRSAKVAKISWHNELPEDSTHAGDRLEALWLPDDGSFRLMKAFLQDTRRRTEWMLVNLPEGDARGWHLYVYLTNEDRSKFSDSQHFYFENEI